MPIEMKLWQKEGDNLRPLGTGKLESEQQLEEWIAADVSIISSDLMIIGRQIQTRYGGYIDLLAMDRDGDLIVIELKKGKTPREVVAQALDYASWVRNLTVDKIDAIASQFLSDDLETSFNNKFGTDLPEELNTTHRIVIVASHLDAASERIVKYLSEEHELDINVVFFSCFTDVHGNMLIGRSWLMEPEAVEDRAERKRGRRIRLTEEQFREIAISHGVGDLFDYLNEKLSNLAVKKERTKSTIRYVVNANGGIKAFLSIRPGDSSSGAGVKTDVRPDVIADAFYIPIENVKKNLPGPGEKMEGMYGEVHYFKSVEDINRLIEMIDKRIEHTDDTRR
jgi:hypothetical protein